MKGTNDGFVRLSGDPDDGVVGHGLADLFLEPGPERFAALFETIHARLGAGPSSEDSFGAIVDGRDGPVRVLVSCWAAPAPDDSEVLVAIRPH